MQPTRIIGIETSSRTGSVALAEGAGVLAEAEFSTQTQHARELLPSLESLYAQVGWPKGEADLCAVSIGPGSFTGLRVAVTFARHLALARAIKIVAVPTLAVIAENCAAMTPPPSPLAVILDAKRAQVFAAVFEWREDGSPQRANRVEGDRETADWQSADRAGGRPTGAYQVIEPAHLTTVHDLLSHRAAKITVTGEGIDYHAEPLAASSARLTDKKLWTPRAASVCRLAHALAAAGTLTAPRDLVPLYIRRPEAEELWEKRQSAT